MGAGTSILLDSAHPLLLNGAKGHWHIDAGAVDIFAVPLAGGAPAGARDHLCRLGAGMAFAGLGADSAVADTGLVVVGLPGTRIVAAAGLPDAAALEHWLRLLSGVLSLHPPKQARLLSAGTAIAVAAGEQLVSHPAVLWIVPESMWLQADWMPAQIPLACQVPFPLGPGAWLNLRAAGEVSCLATADLLQRAGGAQAGAGLTAFHDGLLIGLRQRRELREQDSQRRTMQRQRADQQRFASGLQGMAEVLSDATTTPVARGGDQDPLIDALQLVLQASGIARLRTGLAHDEEILADRDDGSGRIEQLSRLARCAPREIALTGVAWWREDLGPLLAFRRDDGSPVALLPVGAGAYRMIDIAHGSDVPLDQAGANSLGETAYMFFRTLPHAAVSFRAMLRFAQAGTAQDSMRMLLYGALGGLLALSTPYATGVLVDSVIPNAEADQLLPLVLLLLTGAIGISAFEITRAIAILRVDGRMDNAIQAAIVDRLLHLPTAFFRRYSAGDLAQRSIGISQLLQILREASQTALLSWVFGLFSYAYLFLVSPLLAMIATLLVVVALGFTIWLNLSQLKIQRRMFDIQGRIASRVFQILNGIAKIRGCGAEKRMFALWAGDFARQKSLSCKTRRVSTALTVFDAGYGVTASLVLFGAVAALLPTLPTGSFLVFNTAFLQFFSATLVMAKTVTNSINVIPLYERSRPILDALPETSAAQRQPGELSGAIEISHVSFRYLDEGPAILDDLSIRIEPGQFVALVGPSGSGKSTLFRLLLGFETPDAGAIYYDAQNLAGLDIGAVRRQLGVVLQNGRLMPGDIFTNIVGAAPLTLDDAWEAARMAGLDEDIRAMPMGMHTLIAEGAGTISGGQKQRLMVARAVVRKPRILLFDEATSALDNQTQAIVARSVDLLNATRVVIAHRLSTVLKADRIFFIEAGRLVESGTYAELMALDGRFAELAQRQLI